MAERLKNVVFLVVVVTVAASLRSSTAATYVVGDALGWTIPPNPTSYSSWASTKTFVVGDILVFNFTSGRHDVTEVTKAAYDSCTGNNPISVESSSPARITLSAAGDRHFICSVPGHCGAGQKLSVTVRGSSSPTPAPRPSTSSPTASPASPPSLSPEPTTAPSPSPRSPSPRSSTAPKASPPTADAPPPENATSPSTDTAPSTQTPTTAPPPPNSATSIGVSSFSSAVLAIAIALMY